MDAVFRHNFLTEENLDRFRRYPRIENSRLSFLVARNSLLEEEYNSKLEKKNRDGEKRKNDADHDTRVSKKAKFSPRQKFYRV